jgi:hypothetical protein
MTRSEAFQLLTSYLQTPNLIKHSLAVEAIMRSLANYFKQDQNLWGLVGLLHDIDYEITKDAPEEHSLKGAEILKNLGFSEEVCEAIKTHNEIHNLAPQSLMAKALFISDPLSGLIVAATLVLPSKKIIDLTPENILHRIHEKSFAKSVRRDHIEKCEEYLNLPLVDLIKSSLLAMQGINQELGL